MLYIDFIGNKSVRFSNLPDGNGRTKFMKTNLQAREDSLGLVWIANIDNWKDVLNCYPPTDITLNGTVYIVSGEFVDEFNTLAQGTVATTTTTTTAFIPPDDLDVSGMGYTSDNIDDYLIHHAFTLATENGLIIIKGNGNPTSKSDAARLWLYNHYVAIDTNEDFIETI